MGAFWCVFWPPAPPCLTCCDAATADACCCGLRCCPQICSEQDPSGRLWRQRLLFSFVYFSWSPSAGAAPQLSATTRIECVGACAGRQFSVLRSLQLRRHVFRDIDEYDLVRKGFACLSRFQLSDACIAPFFFFFFFFYLVATY